MNVEGDTTISDEEPDTPQDDESPEASSILSPASRRAKKRQAAARNKRAKLEAKQQASSSSVPAKTVPGLHVKPQSSQSTLRNASLSSTSSSPAVNGQQQQQQSAPKTNGASSTEKPLPTIVNDSASIDGRLAADSAAPSSSSSGPHLGDPFLTVQQQSQQPASSQASSSAAPSNYAASAATETEEEDASILLDGDDESSSSSDQEDYEGDVSLQQAEKQNLAEPPTPRPAPPKTVLNAAGNAATALKSSTSSALNAIAQSSAVPPSVQDLAASAKDSDLLKTETAAANAQQYGSDHDPSKKWKSVVTRTVWTLVMIAGFCGE